MADVFPRSDGDFSAWATQFFRAAKDWWNGQGFDPADLNPLEQALDEWNAACAARVAAHAAARAATRTKDAARRALEARIRPLARVLQAHPAVTNADRAAFGITVRRPGVGALPAPTSAPLVIVDAGRRLTHEVRLVDELTPTRRARPRGVERAEVFVALTPTRAPAPSDPGAYRYAGSVRDGSTTLTFGSAQGGLQAHYLARWVTRRGAMGPWSDPASATVAA
jgi:hypothetical protein